MRPAASYIVCAPAADDRSNAAATNLTFFIIQIPIIPSVTADYLRPPPPLRETLPPRDTDDERELPEEKLDLDEEL